MARQSHAKSRWFQLPSLLLRGGRPAVCACPIHDYAPVPRSPTARVETHPECQVDVGLCVRERRDRSGSPGLVEEVWLEALLFVQRSRCNGRQLGGTRHRTGGCGPVWRLLVLRRLRSPYRVPAEYPLANWRSLLESRWLLFVALGPR